jgi:hypothetical protein
MDAVRRDGQTNSTHPLPGTYPPNSRRNGITYAVKNKRGKMDYYFIDVKDLPTAVFGKLITLD